MLAKLLAGRSSGRRDRPGPRALTIKSHHKESTTLEMVLREGKNREIRRVLARVGHKVLRLTRIAVGPVRLGSLPPGAVADAQPRGSRRLASRRTQLVVGQITVYRGLSPLPRRRGQVHVFGRRFVRPNCAFPAKNGPVPHPVPAAKMGLSL